VASRRIGILAKAVEQREAARVSALFFPLSDRAHLPKGVGAGVRWRHARSDVVLNEMLEMVVELLVELPFYLAGFGAASGHADEACWSSA
jgi:hypothetical protein